MKLLNKISVLLILAGYFFIAMPYLTNPFVAFIGAILSIFTAFYIFDSKSITQHEKLKAQKQISGQWWEMFLNHPARMMLTTFMVLCCFGTILLILPISASNNNLSISNSNSNLSNSISNNSIKSLTSSNSNDILSISASNKLESFRKSINIIDAAFTSVSAVCVTGLVVLDTPKDFSVTGQAFILLLIQLGGLGIMSITTVGLHAMGRRLTLRQERLLTTITDTDHKDLIDSLSLIIKFTFTVEGFGAIILTLLFYYQTGDTFSQALWSGLFTSISAFCNAGFALQSDNLIPYKEFPLILHTVAALIILGGIAPATTLLIPKWIKGQNIPVASYIALATTAILLISGTLFILVFDWNGVLSNLSILDKIHNAWFQSVTLRTAGFNSVDIAGVTAPTFLIMICLMFIGGSPGGTAGGIKTTTMGILVLTFWANITNNKSVVVLNRRIQSRVIYRAITIAASGALTWVVMVLMLEVTQQIPVSEIIFEVTSAMATVGLSTGATMKLDEIGKIIIMITMFAGRICPITIFMLLSEERYDNSSRYQNAKISLT
ncbi:MAG: potassium transporter TrkH [Desulfamplus sp.]|nr:potassium transporter TrkH [Desulfamplus sp.]